MMRKLFCFVVYVVVTLALTMANYSRVHVRLLDASDKQILLGGQTLDLNHCYTPYHMSCADDYGEYLGCPGKGCSGTACQTTTATKCTGDEFFVVEVASTRDSAETYDYSDSVYCIAVEKCQPGNTCKRVGEIYKCQSYSPINWMSGGGGGERVDIWTYPECIDHGNGYIEHRTPITILN